MSWAAEVLSDELALGARTPRTLRALVLQPGRLTEEWIRGHRARYVGPLRLFLIATALFFAVVFFLGFPLGQGIDPEALLSRSEVPIGNDVQEIAMAAWAGHLQTFFTLSVFLLVPAFALWMALLHRRTDRIFVDHLVFSLHQHTLFLALTTLAWPLFFYGWWGLAGGMVFLVGAGVHTFLAYRRVYGGGWWRVRFAATGSGWLALLCTVLVLGMFEWMKMIDADYDPAMRYHAVRLWVDAHGHDAPTDTTTLRTLRALSLAAYHRVDTPYLLSWDPYRIADLEVELGRATEALEWIERFRKERPGTALAPGLAALAAARMGDSTRARTEARIFLERIEDETPSGDSPFYPRYLLLREHAVDLLGRDTPPS